MPEDIYLTLCQGFVAQVLGELGRKLRGDALLSGVDLGGEARFSSRSVGNSRRATSDKMLAFVASVTSDPELSQFRQVASLMVPRRAFDEARQLAALGIGRDLAVSVIGVIARKPLPS